MNKAKNKVIFDVFFREKPAMMLVELKIADANIYASVLAKQIDCTYSHVVKILQEMEKAGLINFEKQGRLKLLTLTKKGQEVAVSIDGAVVGKDIAENDILYTYIPKKQIAMLKEVAESLSSEELELLHTIEEMEREKVEA